MFAQNYQLLNHEEHHNFLLKHHEDPQLYCRDILHSVPTLLLEIIISCVFDLLLLATLVRHYSSQGCLPCDVSNVVSCSG